MMLRLALAAALMLVPATPAIAQNYLARADSLLRGGRVFAAETLYYYSVRRQPRDPAARLALGRYLAARGALRVGAVLMEEARYFGGDAKLVARHLAPVYAELGDFRALASLPGSPLRYPERARAEWLQAHPPAVSGPDSLLLRYSARETGSLGLVTLVVGEDTLRASIDPRVKGLVLDTAWARRAGVRTFASRGDRDITDRVAVVRSVRLGEYLLENVPARFETIGAAGEARIGLDVLAEFAPTFDQQIDVLMLRKGGHVAVTDGLRIPTFSDANGIWLLGGGRMQALLSPTLDARLRGARWTLDKERGEIVVER